MPAGPIEIIGIAFVVRDLRNSMTMLYSSKDVDQIELDYEHDRRSPFISTAYSLRLTGINLSAHCGSMHLQVATPIAPPVAIEQRGIYLPDLSFRALPPPSD